MIPPAWPIRQQLRNHVLNDSTVNVSESQVATAVAVSQILVVQSHQVQHRSPQVVDVALILGDMVTELVGRAVNRTALHAPACQPNAIAIGVMVAPIASLRKRRATELAGPDNQCIIKQTVCF